MVGAINDVVRCSVGDGCHVLRFFLVHQNHLYVLRLGMY